MIVSSPSNIYFIGDLIPLYISLETNDLHKKIRGLKIKFIQKLLFKAPPGMPSRF